MSDVGHNVTGTTSDQRQHSTDLLINTFLSSNRKTASFSTQAQLPCED